MSDLEPLWDKAIDGLKEGKWLQGWMGADGAHCAIGWTTAVAGTQTSTWRSMVRNLSDVLAEVDANETRRPRHAQHDALAVMFWNDEVGRKLEEVIEVFEKARAKETVTP